MAKLTFNSILVVCAENICRSPTAERLLQHQLPEMKIKSAGETASDVAARHGISLNGHVASRLTPNMAHRYDLSLVMETARIQHATVFAPEVRDKTLLFGLWLAQKEIPYLYHKSLNIFEYVYGLLEQACQQWVQPLRQ